MGSPLGLYLRGEARAAAIRMKRQPYPGWDGLGDGRKRGHLFLAGYYSPSETDRVPPTLNWNEGVTLNLKSLVDGAGEEFDGFCAYSDGSVRPGVMGGAGFGVVIVENNNIIRTFCGSVGNFCLLYTSPSPRDRG